MRPKRIGVGGNVSFCYYVQRRSPRLIYQVVGQSRDDVLTAVHRREAIIPARILDCSVYFLVVL
jgi:hypothetical protein